MMGVGETVGVLGGAAVGIARVTVGRGGMVESDIAPVGSAVRATVGVSTVTTWPQLVKSNTTMMSHTVLVRTRPDHPARTKKGRVRRGYSDKRGGL
jgi:hypothetical protein